MPQLQRLPEPCASKGLELDTIDSHERRIGDIIRERASIPEEEVDSPVVTDRLASTASFAYGLGLASSEDADARDKARLVANIAALFNAGAEIDARDDEGRTPLYIAAQYGSAENLNALLDAGANTAIEDVGGKFAWDLAKGRKEIQDSEAYRRLDPSRPDRPTVR